MTNSLNTLAAASVAVAAFAAAARSWAQCDMTWDLSPGTPGLNNTVESARTFNGDLVVGGIFWMAGDAVTFGVARWDGTRWHEMGAAPNPGLQGWVYALHEYHGVLLAGGTFTSSMNGLTMRRIAQWTGSDWAPVEGGIRGDFSGPVYAMATFRDELIAAGAFAEASHAPAHNIARWDGSRWQPLGDGLTIAPIEAVNALVVYQDHLIAGGWFSVADGVPALSVAAWDGSQWLPLGDGLDADVYALAVHEGELYAAGTAENPDDQNRYYTLFARWNGTAWEHLEGSFYREGSIRALQSFDHILYAGGDWDGAPALGAWDGTNWTVQWPSSIFALAETPFGLAVAGRFDYLPNLGQPIGRIVYGTPNPCAADFNCDGVLNSQDFFDFLNAFFTNDSSADFNHDGVINSQDFFDFLGLFFTGC